MGDSSYVGYLNYIVFLFLVCGAFTLTVDLFQYGADKALAREKKAAQITGWLNIGLGAALMIGSWVYKRYIW